MFGQRSTSDKLVIFGSLAALVLLVVACFFVANLINNVTAAALPLVSGALLLIGNRAGLRELIRTRQPSPAVFNAMIGLALILFGMGTTIFGATGFRFVFYLPGLALLLLALPIALGRPSIYDSYRRWGNTAVSTFRRATRGSSAQPGRLDAGQPGQPTINLDPDAYKTPRDQQRR